MNIFQFFHYFKILLVEADLGIDACIVRLIIAILNPFKFSSISITAVILFFGTDVIMNLEASKIPSHDSGPSFDRNRKT